MALEIDQHFIAAILTVMGYTMTESVVVFDRIREYLGHHHTADDKHVINEALNATLSLNHKHYINCILRVDCNLYFWW